MDLQPDLVILLLVLTVLGIAACSLQHFLSCRQFSRRHRCQPVMRCSSKDPFLGLDTILGTIRAVRDIGSSSEAASCSGNMAIHSSSQLHSRPRSSPCQ
ncbi:hypothetical protein BDW68DRAFT_159971 [Aspergillus falconensis]